MAKYKLTVKYNDVCDLSIAGDIPDIIGNEFDQYVKSMLFKKDEWENFETSFKQAAKQEYGNIGQDKEQVSDKNEEVIEDTDNLSETPVDVPCADDAPVFIEDETSIDKLPDVLNENVVSEIKEEKSCIEAAEINLPTSEEKKEEDETAKEIPGTPIKKQKTKDKILSFGDYIKNKDINTPLDEFVAGACYLDEILNIKKFSLKQLNSKLYPAFGRLASSNIINQAIDRVLIEVHREGKTTQYSINDIAWNYYNYDLVRH